MSAALDLYAQSFADGWRRERRLSIADWADEHRVLAQAASAEPGRWRTDRTPYLREIMENLSPYSPIERVVFMAGAQVGKTESGNNWIGYVIDHSPGPMLMVQPTVDVAKRVSKQRIAPMIASTPALAARVSEARSRDSGNTLQVKEFEGGVLIITGANSGSGLRSMPIRFLFMDEVDEYPGDVDGQGDPVALAEKRTSTFSRRKILLTSTPTIKGLSRIEREFLRSDQRRYFVPCPHCDHFDWIRWENIRFEKGQPETARLKCINCEALIEERYKTEMLRRGAWRATATAADRKIAGYHLSALYSPLGWRSWSEIVNAFEAAKDDPMKLKTWVNTDLGETWEERGEALDVDTLYARREPYEGVPTGVGVLIAAVDVQGDRLEAMVRGYGAMEESWLIDFAQIIGDPAQAATWTALDRWLSRVYEHENGQKMVIERVVIDSGGLHTEEVYRYVAARDESRFFAIKGGNLPGSPLVARPTMTNRYRIPLFVLGVDSGKEIITSHLRIASPGPGYMHFPIAIDREYFEQLTAEKAVRKWVKNRGVIREWHKVRPRNEALDLEVYALAGLYMCGAAFMQALPERASKLARPVEPGEAPAAPEGPPTLASPGNALPRRRPSSWIDGWR